MSGFWEHSKKYLRLGVEIMQNAAALSLEAFQAYLRFLWLWLFLLSSVGAALLCILVGAWLAGWAVSFWLFVFLSWVGIEAVIMTVLASPLLWAGQQIHDRFPSIRRSAQTIAAVAFWGMLLPFISLQPGVRENPQTIFSLLGLLTLLAVGSYAGIVWLPERLLKRVVAVQLLIALFLVVLSIKFPNTIPALRWRTAWADAKAGDAIAGPSQEVVLDDPKRLVFVSNAGKPLIYGAKEANGVWRFRDGPGFLPFGQEAHAIVSQAERDEVNAQVQAKYDQRVAEQAALDARRRAEELARQEAEKKRLEAEREETKRREEAENKRREAERLEQEREHARKREVAEEQYRLTHVRQPVNNNVAAPHLAALAKRQGAGADRASTDALLSVLKSQGIAAAGNILLDASATDGVFDKLYNEDASEMTRLRLHPAVGHLLLARSAVDVKGPSSNGLRKATVSLEVRLLSTETGSAVDTFSLSADGVGFSAEKAEEHAREELLAKLNRRQFASLNEKPPPVVGPGGQR